MKWLMLSVLILVMPNAGQASEVLHKHQLWVTQNIQWKKAPSEHHPKLSYGVATVLYFGPDGKFGMIDCVLNKEGRSLTVSAGDGINVYSGEWSEQNGLLTVSYRAVSKTVTAVGETLPGPIQTATVTLDVGGNQKAKRRAMLRLNFKGSTYIPTAQLDVEYVTTLLPK